MLTFAAAVTLLLITPGPGVLAIAGVGAGFGYRAGVRFLAGLAIGNGLVATLVVTGLAAILVAMPVLRVVLFAASATYILYLAARVALAGSRLQFAQMDRAPGIVDAVVLQLLNPKGYVVNTTFFLGFPFMPEAPATEVALKVLIFYAVFFPIHSLWMVFGVWLGRLEVPPRVHNLINGAMALAMVAVVAIAGYVQFA